jgi:hypothetical protein
MNIMKKHNTTPQQDSGIKRYVPYGMNGMYYIYDNDLHFMIPGQTGSSSRRMIQRKCEQLNHEEQQQDTKEVLQDEERYFEETQNGETIRVYDLREGVMTDYESIEHDCKTFFDFIKQEYEYEVVLPNSKEVLQDKHTQGEWKWKVDDETDSGTIFIYSERFGGIAKIPVPIHREEHEANAGLIVKAVNNYQSLVDALRDSLATLTRWQEAEPDKWDERDDLTLHNIQTALNNLSK